MRSSDRRSRLLRSSDRQTITFLSALLMPFCYTCAPHAWTSGGALTRRDTCCSRRCPSLRRRLRHLMPGIDHRLWHHPSPPEPGHTVQGQGVNMLMRLYRCAYCLTHPKHKAHKALPNMPLAPGSASTWPPIPPRSKTGPPAPLAGMPVSLLVGALRVNPPPPPAPKIQL